MGIFEKAKNITDTDLRIVIAGASDPAEALKRHILGLEETQRQLRSSAGFLDGQRKWLEESIERMLSLAEEWDKRAAAAVGAGRDDLARHAIRRKKELLRSLQGDRRDLDELTPRMEEVRSRLTNLRRQIARAREVRATLSAHPEEKIVDAGQTDPSASTEQTRVVEEESLDEDIEQEVDEELRRLKRRLTPDDEGPSA